MKKLTIAIAAGALVLGLAACGDDKPAPAAPTTARPVSSLWTDPIDALTQAPKPAPADELRKLWQTPEGMFGTEG